MTRHRFTEPRSRTVANCMEAADKEASFDWATWNAEMDAALDRWNRVERELSELHIATARDLRKALP